jgi:hypothetical protein
MGLSTGRDLHIDQHLTQVAINYRPANLIADQIAPIVGVNKESDLFPVFSRAEALATEETLRSRGAEANKITRSVSSLGYLVKNHALQHETYIEDLANMDAAYQTELGAGASRYLLDKLGLGWELRILNQVNSATNVASTFVPNSSWVGATSPGDPIEQIMKMIEQQQGLTGQRPNSLLFGWRAWLAFRRNPNVRNMILGRDGRGLVTRQSAQDLFEVDRLLVSEAFFNTANEKQPAVYSSPFHDRVMLYFAPMAASRDNPSYMYTFRWNNPALPAPLVIERHPYDSKRKVEAIEAGYYQDEKVVGTDYAATLIGVNSAQSNGI